jgi:hypothetical protein
VTSVNLSSISFGINRSMFRYRIQLLDREGSLASEHVGLFRSDEVAIDHAGGIDHPHALSVWRSGRLVADFPPVRHPRSATRFEERLSDSELRLLRAAMVALDREFDLDELVRSQAPGASDANTSRRRDDRGPLPG